MDIRKQLNETHTLLQTAIQTYEFEHWVEYKNKRNITQKNINNSKKQYTINI